MSKTHAIVIGGSIAGLCAARVLRSRFDKVTILDRDRFPERPESRSGIPQARHVHALLARGALEFERLFPGFFDRMRAAGMNEIDFAGDMAALRPDGWQIPFEAGIKLCLASRDLTEFVIRSLARERGDLEIHERVEVSELRTAVNDKSHVVGVVATSKDGRARQELDADLVVDASGRASKAPDWMRQMGKEPAPQMIVDSFAGYSSRWFKRPPPERWPKNFWWRALWLDPAPPDDPTGAVMFPIEGDRWIVTLIGFSRNYPPSDEPGFMKALRKLRSPMFAEAVALSEPISPVYSNRALVNRFRRYDRMPDPPRGFIAIGDSVCVFNPSYGQGMTAVTLCAKALEDTLAQVSPISAEFSRAFFRAQAAVLEDPWAFAVSTDFRFPGTQGERPPGTAIFQLYSEALANCIRTDPVVLRRAAEVYFMLRPNKDLLEPAIAARILRSSIEERARRLLGSAPIASMPPPRSPQSSRV